MKKIKKAVGNMDEYVKALWQTLFIGVILVTVITLIF